MSYTPVEIRHVKLRRGLFGYRRGRRPPARGRHRELRDGLAGACRPLGPRASSSRASSTRYRELEALLRTTLVSAERAARTSSRTRPGARPRRSSDRGARRGADDHPRGPRRAREARPRGPPAPAAPPRGPRRARRGRRRRTGGTAGTAGRGGEASPRREPHRARPILVEKWPSRSHACVCGSRPEPRAPSSSAGTATAGRCA